MFLWPVLWFAVMWALSEATRVDDLVCALIALLPSVIIVGVSMFLLERLSEKWAKKDTLEYYRSHPNEYIEMLKRIEAEKNSTLKKFY